MKIIDSFDQFIHCEVYHLDGEKSHNLTVIYTHNQLSQRRKLLVDIKNYAKSIQGTWMVIGDFNNVLNVAERIDGKYILAAEFSDLEEMMEEICLHEHETRGSHYTWSNKHTNGMIYSRIDRAICNKDWFITYHNCDIEVFHPHISDHSPLKVKMKENSETCRHKSGFKFLNYTEFLPR